MLMDAGKRVIDESFFVGSWRIELMSSCLHSDQRTARLTLQVCGALFPAGACELITSCESTQEDAVCALFSVSNWCTLCGVCCASDMTL